MALRSAPARRIKPEVMAVRFVQAMDRTDDAAIIQRSFQAVVEELGFASVTCATLPVARHLDPACLLMSTGPAAWAEAYFSNGYARFDPVLREIVHSRCAFTWPDVLEGRTLSRRERDVLSHAARFGLVRGFAVPIAEAGGNVGFVNVAGAGACLDGRRRSALTLVSIYVYHKLRALAAGGKASRQRLSPREAEILHWIAEGKSDWQIGRILAISAKTVNYHTENVKRKFGVATRMQAVVSAIQQRQLMQ
ncbi:MAG: autoinducer binding domain-containing protein [Hyphomicrobiaceae bacterium]|nr:autoinducer binding domain-containing protein [Hyphomicrobiaceae bacterium]